MNIMKDFKYNSAYRHRLLGITHVGTNYSTLEDHCDGTVYLDESFAMVRSMQNSGPCMTMKFNTCAEAVHSSNMNSYDANARKLPYFYVF